MNYDLQSGWPQKIHFATMRSSPAHYLKIINFRSVFYSLSHNTIYSDNTNAKEERD